MKIGIVGSGMVGSTAAFAMVMRGVGREIVLVDKDGERARAEAEDLTHAVPFADPLLVEAADYAALSGCRLVVLTAGASQKPGESRLDLLKRNAAVFRQVVPQVIEHAPDALLVVATNPVDVMTHLAARHAAAAGIPGGRVFGSGTMLDTARFRSLLGRKVGVDSRHIHAYVVGEHGESEVLAWSQVRIGAMELEDFCARNGICMEDADRREITERVVGAAETIIAGKGATYYGIGSALARIADVVVHGQRSVLTVATPTDAVGDVRDVSLSLPRLVGGDGIRYTFPLSLDRDEAAALAASAAKIRDAIRELDEDGN